MTQQLFPSPPNYEVGIETLVNQNFFMHKIVFLNQFKKLQKNNWKVLVFSLDSFEKFSFNLF